MYSWGQGVDWRLDGIQDCALENAGLVLGLHYGAGEGRCRWRDSSILQENADIKLLYVKI